MSVRFFAILFTLFAYPVPSIDWADGGKDALSVQLRGPTDNIIVECIKRGIKVRYRYQFKLCDHRRFWFDGCENEVTYTGSLRLDPVSQSYKALFDRWRDKEDPVDATFSTMEEALVSLERVDGLKVSDLAPGMTREELRSNWSYISARVHVGCEGDSYETLKIIPYIMTLGLVEPGAFDSGWVDFGLSW